MNKIEVIQFFIADSAAASATVLSPYTFSQLFILYFVQLFVLNATSIQTIFSCSFK